MKTLFFLIRLPAFAIGVLLLAAFGFWAFGIGLTLGMFIVLLGVPLWLVILFPGSIVMAAFSDDPQIITSFLRWTRDDIIGEAAKWLRENIPDYFMTYKMLGMWLVGTLQKEP
jgi:hypothetical protein